MFISTIDLIIFISFLSFLLLISKYNTPKILTIQSYVSCSAGLSTFGLFAIVFGTSFNAISLFNTSQQVGLLGLSYFVTACADAIRVLLLCFFIKGVFALRTEISVGKIIEKAYGAKSRIIAGVCSFIFSFAILVIQIKWIYHTIKNLFIINFNIASIILIFILIYYIFLLYKQKWQISLRKLLTDLMIITIGALILYYACNFDQQLVCFAIIFSMLFYTAVKGNFSLSTKAIFEFSLIIVLLPIVFSEIGVGERSVMQMLAMLPEKMRSITPEIFSAGDLAQYSKMFFSTVIPILNPLMIQRIQLASSYKQAQQAFVFSSLTLFIFLHLISICALIAFYFNPKIVSGYNNVNAFLYLIDEIVSNRICKGIVFCSILSVMFSTIDAAINVANISIIRDILNYKKSANISKPVNISTLFLACLTFVVSYFINFDVKGLLMFALNIWVAIITVPFWAQVFKINAPKQAFYASAISGSVVYAVYHFAIFDNLELVGAVTPIIITNVIVFYLAKLIFNFKNTNVSS